MTSITSVVIIYNPQSTGDSEKNAREFTKKLKTSGIFTRTIPTTHRGHAKELAAQIANSSDPPMIISSSGDGGYNEVVNGVLGSNHPDTVVGVLPSGNANDHYHALHHGDTIKRIKRGDIDEIDVLKLEHNKKHRYAHSYIGLGMTSQIGKVLTENNLNLFTETWLVLTHLFRIRPVKLRIDGHVKRYDHLVFANIDRMSKYIKINQRPNPNDGKFAVVAKRYGSVRALFTHLFHSATRGVTPIDFADSYTLTCLRPITIQLDGEVVRYRKNSTITITSEHKKLRTIV